MIGIVVADENELNKINNKKKETLKINQFKYERFFIDEKEIILVHSKIGIANAAAATQSLIDNFKVKSIFNYGAVGATNKLDIYDIVLPKKIFYHDVITPWYERGVTPGEKEFYKNYLKGSKHNNLASGSSFLYQLEKIKEVKKYMDVDIFDMETAAIAQIADKNNISVHVIKCVSDIVGVDQTDLEDINTRIKKAGKKAFNKMIEIIREGSF